MIRVLGDRVLVALAPKALTQETNGYTSQVSQLPSGLFLAKPPDAWSDVLATRGLVTQLGERPDTIDLDDALAAVATCEEHVHTKPHDGWVNASQVVTALRALAHAPFEVQVGEMVLFPPTAGEQITVDGLEYVILRESDIVGIVAPSQEQQAV